MTSISAPAAINSRQPLASGWRLPLALYALVGFGELLAAQNFASSSGALICLPAFALGAAGADAFIRRGRMGRPWLAFGLAALALGVSTVGYSYWGNLMLAVIAAAAMGALFPRSSPEALAASLAGALVASAASPFLMAALGLRGASWICLGLAAPACFLAARLPEAKTDLAIGLPFAAPFGAGAMLFALLVIWKHLLGVVIESSVDAVLWMSAAVLLGLLLGAVARPVKWALLFQCGALLLTAQVVVWDRVPGWFQPGLIFLLLTPPAAVAGAIYRRIPIAPAANAWGGLTGALLAMFVLVPAFGAEVSLKGMALILCVLWAIFLRREPLTRARLASGAAVAVLLLVVLLGRWWNWGLLNAGTEQAGGPAAGVRYLPASLIFKHEDMRGGFTTVVEQTAVTGEVGHTVRTLFRNGRVQGDDSQDLAFVPGTGSALVVGLGTGRGAAALRRLGYGQIVVAETSAGVVKAAQEVFNGANEGILGDPRVRLEAEDGRGVPLENGRQYDLIAIDSNAAELDSREFYQLAHSRLRPGGALQRSLAGPPSRGAEPPGAIGSQLATARSVFADVTVWREGAQALLVAANGPKEGPSGATLLLDAPAVERLLAAQHPAIVTQNLKFLSQYR